MALDTPGAMFPSKLTVASRAQGVLQPSVGASLVEDRSRSDSHRHQSEAVWPVLPSLAAGALAWSARELRSRRKHARKMISLAATVEQTPMKIGWSEGEGEAERIAQIYDQNAQRLPPSGDQEEGEPEPRSANPDGDATVFSVVDDVAIVISGGPLTTKIRPGTLVFFDNGGTGVLLAWKELVCAVYIQPGSPVPSPGDTLMASEAGPFLNTKKSTGLAGRILSPLGRPIDGLDTLPDESDGEDQLTFAEYKGQFERSSIYRPLVTGVLGIDMGVPIGRGQTMLIQGSEPIRDQDELWLDTMCIKADSFTRKSIGVTVCDTLESAQAFKRKLEERGAWSHSIIVVPDAQSPGARLVAMNGAMAIAEQVQKTGNDAVVQLSLEPMSRVWMLLASEAATEREQRGIFVDPQDERWVELEGTMVRESISERRRFWFSIVSRALNSKEQDGEGVTGSVSFLAWLWEQEGGEAFREQKALKMKLERIKEIPRLEDHLKEKMVAKLKEEAAMKGIPWEEDGEEPLKEPPLDAPGVANWEIEELKSITDGHTFLLRPEGDDWGWSIDLVKSLPRLGTDAMHKALLSVKANSLRLRMLQGNDRAKFLDDRIADGAMLDAEEPLNLAFAELLLQQPCNTTYTVEEEAARILITDNPRCKALQASSDISTLDSLVDRLLGSEAGKKLSLDIRLNGVVSEEGVKIVKEELADW